MKVIRMFQLKKWIWIRWQRCLGADRAYAHYLKHFAHFQAHRVDAELQAALAIRPLSKADFLRAWQSAVGGSRAAANSNHCGCGKGGCS